MKRPPGGWNRPTPPENLAVPTCPECLHSPHTPGCLLKPLPWHKLRELVKDPVTPAWPPYPAVHLKCFTQAQHHPLTKHVFGCARCQFSSHAFFRNFGPLRCVSCGCPAIRHRPLKAHPKGSHECMGCGSIHDLKTHTPLPPLPPTPAPLDPKT